MSKKKEVSKISNIKITVIEDLPSNIIMFVSSGVDLNELEKELRAGKIGLIRTAFKGRGKKLNYKKLWLGLKIYQGHYVVSKPAEPNCIINTVKGLMNEYEKIIPGKF